MFIAIRDLIKGDSLALLIVDFFANRQELLVEFEGLAVFAHLRAANGHIGEGKRFSIPVTQRAEDVYGLVVDVDRLLVLPKCAVNPGDVVQRDPFAVAVTLLAINLEDLIVKIERLLVL